MWPFGLCTSGVCTVIFGLIYHGILSLLDCLRLLDCTWKHAACGVFAYLKYVASRGAFPFFLDYDPPII